MRLPIAEELNTHAVGCRPFGAGRTPGEPDLSSTVTSVGAAAPPSPEALDDTHAPASGRTSIESGVLDIGSLLPGDDERARERHAAREPLSLSLVSRRVSLRNPNPGTLNGIRYPGVRNSILMYV